MKSPLHISPSRRVLEELERVAKRVVQLRIAVVHIRCVVVRV